MKTSCPARPLTLIPAALAMALALATGLTACRRPVATDPSASRAPGHYELQTVDGRPLPTPLAHGTVSLEIRSGSLVLTDTGTGESRMRFVTPDGVERTRVAEATWQVRPPLVEMRWKQAGRTFARIEGDSLTMTNEGTVLRYQRR